MEVKIYSEVVQEIDKELFDEIVEYIDKRAGVCLKGTVCRMLETHDVILAHFKDFDIPSWSYREKIEVMIAASENYILDLLYDDLERDHIRGMILSNVSANITPNWECYAVPEDLKEKILEKFELSILYTKLLKGDI